MIASSTLDTLSFHFSFIPNVLLDKLYFLLLTPCLSSSQLYSLVQTTLLPLTLTSVILFLLLVLGGDEVHVEEFFLPLGWVGTDVFLMHHGLAEARGDTVQDDIDEVMVSPLDIDIESINIIQVFLESTCLFEITCLVKSPVRLIMVAIGFPNGGRDFSPSIEPMVVRFAPFQRISFCTRPT